MNHLSVGASVEVEVNYRPVTGILEDSDTEKVDSDEEPIIELQFDLVIGSDGAQSTIRNLGKQSPPPTSLKVGLRTLHRPVSPVEMGAYTIVEKGQL